MQEHLIIIGGVAAGTKAAAKARRDNPELKITVYTDGEYISYSACGLPYYIGDVFNDYNKLIVRSVEAFKKENIDIYTKHKVTGINPDKRTVKVINLNNNKEFEDNYSKLLIATGARAFVPPIEGVNLSNIFTLRCIKDGIAIKDKVNTSKKAVIVGAGLIGLEVAESFFSRGLETTIIELAPQILAPLDPDMAGMVQEYIETEKHIKVITGDGVKKFIGNKKQEVTGVETSSGQEIEADLVLLSIGIKPNSEIAKACGVETGQAGTIRINSRMETNLPHIYAAGDCAEKTFILTGEPAWIPLGSTANKEGRVAAINMTGGNEEFRGILGSLVTKIFDYTVTKTGLNEKEAQKYGYEYETVTISHRDRAGYLPGAEKITIKLLAEKKTERLLGAQIIGKGDADKRINVIAAALNQNLKVSDIADLDLTYAPPYSPAIDPLLTALHVLKSKIKLP